MTAKESDQLIHIAKIQKRGVFTHLFLRRTSHNQYVWFEEFEIETEVKASSIEEAIRLARRTWERDHFFRTLGCGFRYTLPERDEHGSNALFHQMAKSLSSFNGIYHDEELGHSCIVQNVSEEARELWRKIPKSRADAL